MDSTSGTADSAQLTSGLTAYSRLSKWEAAKPFLVAVITILVIIGKGRILTLAESAGYSKRAAMGCVGVVDLGLVVALAYVFGSLYGKLFPNPLPVDEWRVTQARVRVREAEQELERVLRLRSRTSPVEIHEEGLPHRPSVSNDAPADGQADEIPPGSELPLVFPDLWKVTRNTIDFYRDSAVWQSGRAFRNSQIAMVAGLSLLFVAMVTVLISSTAAGVAVSGALGVIAAGMTSYVSRTFLRSQELAARNLRPYIEQSVELMRYLTAERLLADARLSDERRAEVLATIVEAMVTGAARPRDEGSGTVGGCSSS